jgi:hypothetical protein
MDSSEFRTSLGAVDIPPEQEQTNAPSQNAMKPGVVAATAPA